MRAITVPNFTEIEYVKLSEEKIPEPEDHEVQIQIAYSGVNPVDWKIIEGHMKDLLPHEFPLIPGWEASGKISKVGKNVENFQVGDEVFAYLRKSVVKWGSYAEYICYDAKHVAYKPGNLSFAQAASIPLAGLTAWQALFDFANLQKDEAVLVHAGSGGVGGMAVQFASYKDANVMATCSEKNQKYVENLGASFTIDYTKEDFVKRIDEVYPEGIDVVLDTVGGDVFKRSAEILRPGGRLVSVVEVAGNGETLKKAITSRKTFCFVSPIDAKLELEYRIKTGFVLISPHGEELKEIAHLLEEEKIHPLKIEEFELADAKRVLEISKSGHTSGKMVIKIH